ncbi:MAG: O-antigen ligase family protein [Mogibacterium sp.]|nr:O-antigen ligase family protein [Mogibacterium sp.]
MYYLQSLYAFVLNNIFKLTGKIDEKIRNTVITLCCLFLSGFFIEYFDKHNKSTLYLHHTHNNIICGAVLIILVIVSVKEPLKRVRWKPFLFYTFFIAGAGIVAVSFLHPIGNGYRSFGLMMMVGFPCLYYVWNNRGDYNVLFKRLSASTAIVGLALYIKCVKMAMAGTLEVEWGERVAAFFYNSNMFSMIGMVMVCAAVYMFIVNIESIIWFIFATLSFACGWGIIFLGGSRLSVLVGAGSIISLLIFGFKIRIRPVSGRTRIISYIKSLCLLLVTVVVIISSSTLIEINMNAINQRDYEAAKDAGNEALFVPQEVQSDSVGGVADRFDTNDTDLNKYSSGRIELWTRYASHLNMWGNDLSKTNFSELTGSGVQHAHNNFLEYGYRCGIPVACIHILLELYAGVMCLIFLFGKKYRDPAYLFAIAFMVCYAVESMFDIATLPFERPAAFYFYMALIPVFFNAKGKDKEVENASNS